MLRGLTPRSATATPSGGGVASAAAVVTAVTTDLVAAPAASTLRSIREVNVYNNHASCLEHDHGAVDQRHATAVLAKTVLAPGETLSHIEGIGWIVIGTDGAYKQQTGRVLFKVLSADDATGTAGTGVQAWFPAAGGVTIAANTTYFFEGSHSMTTGATSTVVNNLFAGTATVSSILYEVVASNAANNTQVAPTSTTIDVATAVAVAAAGTGVNKRMSVQGAVRFTTAGTFIPQFNFTINPTGTITIKRNSFF
jgi:hypothetical protein